MVETISAVGSFRKRRAGNQDSRVEVKNLQNLDKALSRVLSLKAEPGIPGSGAGNPAGSSGENDGDSSGDENIEKKGIVSEKSARAVYPATAPGIPAQTQTRRFVSRRDGRRCDGFQAFLRSKNAEQRRIYDQRALEDEKTRHSREEERDARGLRRRQEDFQMIQARAAEDTAHEARWKREDHAKAEQRAREDMQKNYEWDDTIYDMRNKR